MPLADGQLTLAIQRAAFERGLMVEVRGFRLVIRFLPSSYYLWRTDFVLRTRRSDYVYARHRNRTTVEKHFIQTGGATSASVMNHTTAAMKSASSNKCTISA